MFTDDHDIERELKAALGVQPSSGFESRILRSAGEAPVHEQRPLWPWLAAAAAVVVMAMGWWLSGGTQPPMPERAVANVPPAEVVPGPPLDRAPATAIAPSARVGGASPSGGVAVGRPPGRPPRAQAPGVLVPPNQLALIQALTNDVRRGRVQLPPVEEGANDLRTIDVPTMTVEPIAITTLESDALAPVSKGRQ
jgi:hypothetical protein